MRQKEPLRALSDDERAVLVHLSRSAREPAAVVARAKAVVAVADGGDYTAAAHAAGRRSGGAGGRLVGRFNQAGRGGVGARAGGGAAGRVTARRARARPWEGRPPPAET